jgi:predicted acetyltransferase
MSWPSPTRRSAASWTDGWRGEVEVGDGPKGMGEDDGMDLTVRALNDDDATAARQLGFEAFGVPSPAPTDPATVGGPGRTSFGAFDSTTLAAKMVDRDFDSYFGGASLATSGIAGVTVAAEYRRRGALTPLFAATLGAARARGAVLSALFPTAPAIYRRFGYEVIAAMDTVRIPSHVLAAVRPGQGIRTRRATSTDVPAIREVYATWASEQNGPLIRAGVSFAQTPEEFLGDFTGVTVAVDDDDIVHGYASWERGQEFGEHAVLRATDLLAVDAAAYRALLVALGSFSSVTAQTELTTSGDDVARLFLPSVDWHVVESRPYMLKLLDVAGALTLRHYPTGFSDELAFQLAGDSVEENNGGYVLDVSNGRGSCVRAEQGGRVFTPAGLSLLFAGAQSCANLRAAGHLTGGDAEEDGTWDAHFGGRQAHIRDFF